MKMDDRKIKTTMNSRMRNKKILILAIFVLISISMVGSAERPAVALVFDDGWTSVYYKAFPIMKANNQNGTEFIITGEVSSATGEVGLEYMNITQLNAIYKSGWDLSSHSVTHPHMTTLSTSNLNAELYNSKEWLNSSGFTRASMFFAYPYGEYNSNVVNAVKSNGYIAARTVYGLCSDRDILNTCYTFPAAYPRYNSTSPDRYEMITLLVDGYGSGLTSPSYIINEINNTIKSNGFLIISFHEIVDTTPGYNEEYTTSDFKKISDYLKSRSADIDVLTLSQLFNSSIVAPLPTPTPTATATSTITATATSTATSIVTATSTSTVTATVTATSTPIITPTSTPIPPINSMKIYPVADTFISSANQNTNYGSLNYISTDVSNRKTSKAILLKYNLSQIPKGANIINATQYMYMKYSVGIGQKLRFNKLTSDFNELSVKWISMPSIGPQLIEYTVLPLSSGWKVINVTTPIQNWYNGTWNNYGFYVNSTNNNDDASFVSKEGGVNKEYILVYYR